MRDWLGFIVGTLASAAIGSATAGPLPKSHQPGTSAVDTSGLVQMIHHKPGHGLRGKGWHKGWWKGKGRLRGRY
jgi:hypothetical protein